MTEADTGARLPRAYSKQARDAAEWAVVRPEAAVPPARPDLGGRGGFRGGSGQRLFSAAALGLPASAVYITKEKPEPGRPRVCRSISSSPSVG